jgi:hypothetical protein
MNRFLEKVAGGSTAAGGLGFVDQPGIQTLFFLRNRRQSHGENRPDGISGNRSRRLGSRTPQEFET